MIKFKQEWFFIIWLMLMCIGMSLYGMTNGVFVFHSLNLMVLLLVLIFSTPEQAFMILVALIPFNDCLRFGSNSIRGIYYFIPCITYMYRNRRVKTSISVLAIGFVWIVIEFLNDIRFLNILQLFNLLAAMIYFLLLSAMKTEFQLWNIRRIGLVYVLSCLISNIALLSIEGGISAFNNEISWYRFGQSGSYLSGAMDIPIQACVSICILLMCFFWDHSDWAWKTAYVVLMGVNILLGMLTVSRVFVLGMIPIAFFVYVETNKRGHLKRSILIVVLGAFVGSYILYRYGDTLFIVLEKFDNRMEGASADARFLIWKDCFSYQFSSIKSFFLGEGGMGYTEMGYSKRYKFYMMTHNLYLDAWMSWGMVGFFALAIMFYRQFDLRTKKALLSYSAIVVFLVMMIVGGSFNYADNYIYIIMLILTTNYAYENY